MFVCLFIFLLLSIFLRKFNHLFLLLYAVGGGTLDVSVLWLQGGIFITLAMAGNNRLGGQDFNDRIQKHLMKVIQVSVVEKDILS